MQQALGILQYAVPCGSHSQAEYVLAAGRQATKQINRRTPGSNRMQERKRSGAQGTVGWADEGGLAKEGTSNVTWDVRRE